jgi:hypothetical protein
MPSSGFYHVARKRARHTAPEVMQGLIGLGWQQEDECVKSAVAAFHGAGVLPHEMTT